MCVVPYLLTLNLQSCTTSSPVSVLKQYKQPAEQNEFGLQEMSKASRTVPDVGEMLHEGGLESVGASVGSGPGIGRMYLAKPGSV